MRIWPVIVFLCLAACGDSDEAPRTSEPAAQRAPKAERIVAVVRSTGWLDDMARQAGGSIYIHHEPLVADLVVVYARDTGTSVEYLTKEQFDAREGSPETRRRDAVQTLRLILPDLARDEVAAGVFALQGDPTYVSSLLLMDEIWKAQASAVKGDLVAVVPTRQAILFSGSKNLAAIARMREIAAKAAADAGYPLSEMLLRRYGGRWIAYE